MTKCLPLSYHTVNSMHHQHLTCALLLRAVVRLLSSLQACKRSSFIHLTAWQRHALHWQSLTLQSLLTNTSGAMYAICEQAATNDCKGMRRSPLLLRPHCLCYDVFC